MRRISTYLKRSLMNYIVMEACGHGLYMRRKKQQETGTATTIFMPL